MPSNQNNKSVIIIGAGFAGMSAGIYAQMNGFKTKIYELHDQPGGLCTSWKRKGYTFDGCIHWLVGSSPKSGMHDLWKETGIIRNMKIIDHEEYMRLEDRNGRTLVFYTDIDKLEKHLLELSPQDEKPIRELIDGVRICIPFEMTSKHDSLLTKAGKQFRTGLNFVKNGKKMQQWMKTTCSEFSQKFRDPLIRMAINEMWLPDFSIFFMLFTLAYLHTKNAGYPIGGSLPMSVDMEKKYRELGGTVLYKQKVTEIITEGNRATGIKTDNGTVDHADIVISAADGYNTLYKMLGNRYGDEKTREPYEKWPVFPSLLYVSLGVNRSFSDIPWSVSGLTFELKEPVMIGDRIRDKLSIHIYNHDETLAPAGKTAVTIMMATDYEYWKKLAENRGEYLARKEEAGKITIEMLEQRFPGISSQIEVIDVATPLTFERYTGNWKGCFEGWLITPDNSHTLMKPMSQTVPGLKDFYMCGQWVEPGGGLPTAVMSGKRVIKRICREYGKKFKAV
jgi:phytoene dehydrogenase-like protein